MREPNLAKEKCRNVSTAERVIAVVALVVVVLGYPFYWLIDEIGAKRKLKKLER